MKEIINHNIKTWEYTEDNSFKEDTVEGEWIATVWNWFVRSEGIEMFMNLVTI